ncbi:MAG: T9SS C-terminal target domain-containing protein [Cytophagales bacterium]|nr:MAG: T9SS C-terminal target domain-containing protein [Cytophagales bacterium]
MKIKLLSGLTALYFIALNPIFAQQVLEKSYVEDEFNTAGNLVTISGSRKVRVSKNIEGGYIDVQFDTLKGGATDDFINFTFSRVLDLSSLGDRKYTLEFESTQPMSCWFVLSNVSWGPYAQAQQNNSLYLFDFGKETVTRSFELSDELKGDFKSDKVSNAYIVLNPTFSPPTFTSGETVLPGSIKIYNLKIGNSSTLNVNDINIINQTNVYFENDNQSIAYNNLDVNSEITVYDMMGKLIKTHRNEANNGKIDCKELDKGIYQVYINNSRSKKSSKVLVY